MTPDRRLRVLMISPQYAPIVGGYERAAQRLSTALAKRGLEVTVLTERRDRSWPRDEISDGVVIRRLWTVHKRRLHLLTSFVSHLRFIVLHGLSFDVWHVHDCGPQAVLASLLGWIMGRPVVVKLASAGEGGLSKLHRRLPFPAVALPILRSIPTFITMTSESEIEARAFGVSESRIVRLTNGIDSDAFRPRDEAERRSLKQQLGLDERNTVLFVGRLDRPKALPVLVAAWTSAAPRLGPNWRLVVVGGGPDADAFAHLVSESNLSDSIQQVGVQSDIETWAGAADAFVLSSAWEGLPNALLEAMSAGLAVAATRVSGVPELVEATGAGQVVPVGDAEALADALVELAGDPAMRAEMGRRGRAEIERTYAIDTVAGGYEALYGRLSRRSH